ncbi:MAG: deaminase [Ignavibacteriales bacterium]|nr:deaminase [Ignavibacteriales bacterium]
MAQTRKKRFTPRQLMELAVQEGERSIPEHGEKEDPFVGAIIATKDGEILAKAHRGELRVGEHCEFTLIERKLRDRDLTDCVLYVTLEPCTNESRGPGKQGCATHISAARIRTVYVGIDDPNPRISREGIRYLISKQLVVHPFDPDLQERIKERNAEFIKEKEEEAKVIRLQSKEERKAPLEEAKRGATIGGLSDTELRSFVSLSKLPYAFPSVEFNKWATEYGLLEQQNGSKEFKPTGLGMMLFGKRPSLLYPQVVFKTEIQYAKGEPEIHDFEDSLVLQWPKIREHLLNKAFRLPMDRSGAERVEVPDYPIDVLREAVVNAIIHRDYTIEGATNYLYIDPEKIIVRSPGVVVPPITIEDLRGFKPSWHSPNPKIMFVFNQMKFAEQRGKGISSMKQLPSLGFPLPTFEIQANALVVTFARTRLAYGKAAMSAQEYKEWLYIQAHQPVTRAQFATEFSLPAKTAQNHLSRLIELRAISSEGKGKAIRYYSRKD